MNKLIASIFSVLFAIFTIFVVIFLIYSSNFYSGYVFFGGLLLFIIFFGFLAVLLDIRDEIILIREKLVGGSGPKEDEDRPFSGGSNPNEDEDRPFFSLGKNPNLPSEYGKSKKDNQKK
tara:strand:+ start:92 stop:448 length:357 start_codon:yes stop_codon:yes gene_type:complete